MHNNLYAFNAYLKIFSKNDKQIRIKDNVPRLKNENLIHQYLTYCDANPQLVMMFFSLMLSVLITHSLQEGK